MECQFCFGEISPKAKKCKHCGEWIKETTQSSSDNDKGIIDTFVKSKNLDQTVNSGIKLYAGYYIISGIIGLILFIIVFFNMVSAQKKIKHGHMLGFPEQMKPIYENNIPPEIQKLLENTEHQQSKNKELNSPKN